MKVTVAMLVTVVILTILLEAVDGVAFPDGFSLALSIVQLVLLVQVLEMLRNENIPPGA